MRIGIHHGALAPATATATERLRQLDGLARAAAGQGARLLVLPQLSLCGWPADLEAARNLAELSDGPMAQGLRTIAARHGLGLLGGYVELCTGRLYDAALFVDEHGRALANYRRVHLAPEVDEPMLAHGQWLTIVPFQGFKLGLLIGADIDGPEQARALALAGAAVLLVAGRHGSEATLAHGAILRARAAENACVLAYANGEAGPTAPASCIVGPDGAPLAATRDGLAVAEVAVAGPARRATRDLVRRPRLYQRLVEPLPGEDAPRL
jgi:predicted amidohydrolase